MKATVKHIVNKVTLELIYDVVDERTNEIKEEIRSLNKKADEMRAEYLLEAAKDGYFEITHRQD